MDQKSGPAGINQTIKDGTLASQAQLLLNCPIPLHSLFPVGSETLSRQGSRIQLLERLFFNFLEDLPNQVVYNVMILIWLLVMNLGRY